MQAILHFKTVLFLSCPLSVQTYAEIADRRTIIWIWNANCHIIVLSETVLTLPQWLEKKNNKVIVTNDNAFSSTKQQYFKHTKLNECINILNDTLGFMFLFLKGDSHSYVSFLCVSICDLFYLVARIPKVI